MISGRKISVGTDSWQPEFIEHHQSDLSRYLDEVSRTDFVQRIAASALELLSLKPGGSVVEVGCGNGVFLPLLAGAVGSSGRVVGIDHSETLVLEAQAKLSEKALASTVDVQLCDAYHLPFPESSFDAAHCERVLIHLDDPNAALAEMQRIVRPGGWIVAAEPDWGGYRIDHVDRTAMDLLCARASRIRQTDMGLTLYRRMGELGLVERRAIPLLNVVTDSDVMKMFGLDLSQTADTLVADGLFTRAYADALLANLEASSAAGRYYCVGLMHVVAGRVPK